MNRVIWQSSRLKSMTSRWTNKWWVSWPGVVATPSLIRYKFHKVSLFFKYQFVIFLGGVGFLCASSCSLSKNIIRVREWQENSGEARKASRLYCISVTFPLSLPFRTQPAVPPPKHLISPFPSPSDRWGHASDTAGAWRPIFPKGWNARPSMQLARWNN